MKNILIGVLSILLLDTIGSIASNYFQFSYSSLWPISIILYALFGHLSYRQGSLRNAAIVGAILGFFDTTLGWKISIWLNAFSPDKNIEPKSTATWIVTIIIGTFFAALIGWIAGVITKKVMRGKAK